MDSIKIVGVKVRFAGGANPVSLEREELPN